VESCPLRNKTLSKSVTSWLSIVYEALGQDSKANTFSLHQILHADTNEKDSGNICIVNKRSVTDTPGAWNGLYPNIVVDLGVSGRENKWRTKFPYNHVLFSTLSSSRKATDIDAEQVSLQILPVQQTGNALLIRARVEEPGVIAIGHSTRHFMFLS
jgi:hypothetical protein